MSIFLKRIFKFVFLMEFHEFLSFMMICFLIILYGFGPNNENLIDACFYLAFSAGIIPTMIISLLILFYVIILFVPREIFHKSLYFLIRNVTSFLVMLFCFESITHYIISHELTLKDAELLYLDNILFFGKQPAVWMESISFDSLTIFFSGAYLSWFLLTYGSILLMWRYGRKALLEYTTTALLTFYIGYIFYIIVPALGPLFTFSFSKPINGLAAMMLDSASFTPAPDAFPSLHTGIAVVMLVVVWRYCKKWTWIYAPVIAAIIISTMYLRIHYGIDVIAGVFLSMITTWLCPLIINFWQKEQESRTISAPVLGNSVQVQT
jgi:membrane-associated phospholipid phosphatase